MQPPQILRIAGAVQNIFPIQVCDCYDEHKASNIHYQAVVNLLIGGGGGVKE